MKILEIIGTIYLVLSSIVVVTLLFVDYDYRIELMLIIIFVGLYYHIVLSALRRRRENLKK